MPTAFLTLDEVLAIHAHQVSRYGGALGIRDRGLLESALAMPQATFGDEILHPSLHEQAAAYLFHIVKNHPFIDGNKRIAHAAMEVFLMLNGWEIVADVDEQERLMLEVAAGSWSREQLHEWLQARVMRLNT